MRTALIKQAGAFANIHDLIETWHQHMLSTGVPIHDGYYSYIEELSRAKGFDIDDLAVGDLPDLMALQLDVTAALGDGAMLRANDEDMLRSCLSDHLTLGARWRDSGDLAAAAILYDGGTGEESIKKYLTDDPDEIAGTINLKLVLTSPDARHQGLARTLIELLEQRAVAAGKREILCTIHPGNKASQGLFTLLGYERVAKVTTSYGLRLVFARSLPSLTKRWSR
ncbi:MAG: GNAT family N-acetyltransferase [Aeromicrobium sp.]|uniref:GNAT family N-acetyltransferase n=1 Tax=Aeromicrobium sp. TaxID=1871063 RepID=UPI0039E6F633